MKKIYHGLIVGLFIMGGVLSGFSQQSAKQQKPIKDLIILEQNQIQTLENSRQLLTNILDLPENNNMKLVSKRKDKLGYRHRTFRQYYKGVKVEFSSSTVHGKNGVAKSISNNVFRIKKLSVQPKVSRAQAFISALRHVGARKYLWQNQKEANFLGYKRPKGKLVVLPPLEGEMKEARLAYRFDIYATAPLYRANVYIDAHTGEFIMDDAKIHHAGLRGHHSTSNAYAKAVEAIPMYKSFYANVSASGESLYNGVVNFTADSYNGEYRLYQTAMGDGVHTFDMNNGTSYSNATEITSSSTTFNHQTGVQAHWGAEQVYQYYYQTFGRNSYDDAGAELLSYVSYGTDYVNAFWDGQRMTYGDGDGVNYGPLVAIDIVGHELTHAVTEYSAALVYQDEPGALNESFSDIFGEAVENYASGTKDWLVGDDIGIGGSGGAIRSIKDPKSMGQPDTYHGEYWYYGVGDNGGVHTNSGVQNYWFYVLSAGDSGTNDNGDSYNVSGIGIEKAAAIAYRNLTVYLSPYSDYSDARAGAIQAAIDLYGEGSAEEIAVTNAWYAVGVGSSYNDGGDTPPPADCVTGDIYLSITFDNYPQETGWKLKDAAGNIIDSHDYTSSTPDGSTVEVTFSDLAAGEYTFIITDTYGDGICCAYGNGSYTLSSDSGVIVSGGEFGSFEATDFCIEGGSPEPPIVYCESKGNIASFEWIDLVELNNMSNPSGSDGGYADNTDLIANLPYGSNTIYISAGFSFWSYTEYWRVWIDFNQNGTFESSELVIDGSSRMRIKMHADFTVPSSALPGTTRMRVSMKFGSPASPCEVFGFGEVEDYTVNIGQAVAAARPTGVATKELGDAPRVFSAKVYPNPVQNNLNVSMGDNREISYMIYDLSGRVLDKGSFKNRETISVNRLSQGVYFIELSDGQKSIVEKFIKR